MTIDYSVDTYVIFDNRNLRFLEDLNYNIVSLFLTEFLLISIGLIFNRDLDPNWCYLNWYK